MTKRMGNAFVKVYFDSISLRQFLFVLVLCLSSIIHGYGQQVSTYTFSQSSGTYSAIVGTTILAANTDEGVSASTGIGFTFYYHGLAYTTFSANSNGFITLGGTSTTYSYSPLSVFPDCISFCGGDGKTNAAVTYLLSGASPNRVLTIQFPDYYVHYNVTTEKINAQIKLYETSNTVQIVYGSSTHTGNTSYYRQVGLSGNTVSDFNNRTSTTSWATTTAGTLNTATVTWLKTNTPANGLIFSWTPCTAPSAPATNSNTLYTPYNGLEHHILQTYASVSGVNGYEYSYSYDNSTWYVGSTSTLLNIN